MSLLTVIQNFCRRTQLPVPATVVGSTDTQVLQVMALLEEEGNDLAARGGWQELTFQAAHATINQEDQGDITDIASNGYRYIKNGTFWDRSLRLPICGPESPVEWQAIKALGLNNVRYKHRIRGNRLLVNPAPPQDGIYLPGGASDSISTPDAAALDITGDIDLVACIAPASWTSGGVIISKWTSFTLGNTQRSFIFQYNTSGLLSFSNSTNGTSTGVTSNSTQAVSSNDGSPLWVRVTLDADNGAAGNTVTFYTSTDGIATPIDEIDWTTLGDPVVNAGTTSIFSSTTNVVLGDVGAGTTTTEFTGYFYRAAISSTIGGTPVADMDSADATYGDTTFVSSETGETWTINGDAYMNASWYFEYVSQNWITNAAGTTYKQYFTADTDLILLPETLVMMGLRWRWKKEKGLDYAEDFRTYEMQVKDALGRDGGRRTHYADGSGWRGPKPGIFVPDGNWNL